MLVSIIITNYNYGKYLHRCIRSCMKQSLNDDEFEVILVDDSSNDNSIEIAKDYLNLPNFKIVSTKKNVGVAKAANLGIKKARGKYVARIDSDDYVTKEFANFLSYYLIENPKLFCVACDYYYVNENEEKIKKLSAKEIPIACGIMYNKKKLINYGGYNSNFKHREEEELRVRLDKKYLIGYLEIPLYRYRLHETNKTRSSDYKEKFKDQIKYLKNIKVMNNILSKNIVVIIPARGGSKRLKNKNIYNFRGKPMIFWSIDASLKSKLVKKTYVSSDSNEILKLAKKYGAEPIIRSKSLSNDKVFKMEVIKETVRKISTNKKDRPTIVISLQANSPEITTEDIDNSVYKLINDKRNEIISINNDLNQNAAIRAMRYKTVFQNSLSTYVGNIVTNTTDIHTKNDINKLLKKYENK